MSRFRPDEFSLLVVDEAHHATAATYKRMIAYYRRNPKLKVLGVTATPDRADEQALGQIFENVSYVYELPQAVRDGWLVNPIQQCVVVESLDFSGVTMTAGDLNVGELADVMEEERNLHTIVSTTIDVAAGRKTLMFAASVKQAERTCEIL
ncbi:MAG: hypothetical protein CUN53_20150, partial [Phototrophicales bacterium]